MKVKKSIRTTSIMLFIASVLLTGIFLDCTSMISASRMAKKSIAQYETVMTEGCMTEAQSEVESAISVLQVEYEKYTRGLMTEAEAQEEAKELIRNMRYREDASGYFWIDSVDYTLVMHPILTEQEGNNRYNEEDQNGVKIIQEIMNVAEEGGFNRFFYTKSDGTTVAPKLAYSKLFEPWGWVVSTGNYVDEMQANLEEANSATTRSLNIMFFVNILASIFLLIVFIISGVKFGNWLCNPIIQLAEAAKSLAIGKVDVHMEHSNRENEIAILQNSFCDMIDNLNRQAATINQIADGMLNIDVPVKSHEDVVGNALAKLVRDDNVVFQNVQSAAGEIHSGSTQIAAASQSLAQGSTEQASAIQQITASVSDIADKSRVNADRVHEVSNIIEEAGTASAAGNTKMQEMVVAMREITEASQNIQKVVKAIDDIAFSTNILALNAAVEASRAGDQGKGFAVVAEEVRSLAGKSANAAKETAELLENTIQKVNRGSVLAKDTEKALETISASIDRIVSLSRDVATASEEQAVGASQIDNALMQVSTVIQTNSSASEQCASASEQLSGQAGELNSQLARFQLRK